MSFLLFIILVILILLASVLRWRKTRYMLVLLTLVLFFGVGTGVAPRYLLNALQQDYQVKPNVSWRENNVIILLGAGTVKVPRTHDVEPPFFAYGRITETAIQYQYCQQTKSVCWVIVSGGDPLQNGEAEAKVYKHVLVSLGVPENMIITEPNSMNTWQNAEFTRRILEFDHDFTTFNQQNSRIVLVTSGLHLRRSEQYFNHFGINAIPIRGDYVVASVSWLPSGYEFALMDFALHEYLGYFRYYVYNTMGWNILPKKEVFAAGVMKSG
ncbi:YdcF family protein [uncultured Shewanella sp.]|uniref:YdcF family protein n=1 Tax=uncultured Shewanella sp. TaxID=173975 RepID=UPI00261F8E2C|nr:YdcF family protein [uncultured Shewanella sp.]